MKQEMYCYDDEVFFSDLGELMDHLDINEELEGIDDDWKIEVQKCQLEPIMELSTDWIMERVDEERYSEEQAENQMRKMEKVLNENIDYAKINELMPKLWYPIYKKITFTKQDLIDWCK